jgi:hypothetical protein
MISPEDLKIALTRLGTEFLNASIPKESKEADNSFNNSILTEAADYSYYHNPWFIPAFVKFAYAAWAAALEKEKVELWISQYLSGTGLRNKPATVGIVMAGNIPMVGLHDLICVLASGHHALIRLSSSDDRLIPAVLKLLCEINPELDQQYTMAEGPLKNFDAIIATGSNNTSRYFDYYFGKYPHITRRNRNGVAVITGNETGEELRKLADDIFIYFGLGCRNVSKLYIPKGYRMEDLLPFFESYSYFSDKHKYRNNYDYQKSILLINRVPHLDNGFLLIKEEKSLMSAIAVVHTETYHSLESLNRHLNTIKGDIQCIVTSGKGIDSPIPPGKSQFPELWDYADGVDVMDFLMNLKKND